jgi:hypothetical protein
LFPKNKFADYKAPTPTYPPSVGHQQQWIEAIRMNKPEMCECHFEYAAPYMEAISVAAMMHRESVGKATWNPAAMQTDSEAVNKHFKPEFRSGWHFPTCD